MPSYARKQQGEGQQRFATSSHERVSSSPRMHEIQSLERYNVKFLSYHPWPTLWGVAGHRSEVSCS